MNTLELAIGMETDAITFYTEAAGRTRHPAGKKMFLAVAEDEKHHLAMITEIIKGLAITPQEVSPRQKVKSVFDSMKDQMMQRVEAGADELEAFKVAMRMEKEGTAAYQKMLAESTKDGERKLLERLVREEQEHYSIFANTYQFLADTGNWFLWEERGIVEGG